MGEGWVPKQELEAKVLQLKSEHVKEVERVREGVRKTLEAEHLKKFTAVSRQIETLQKAELENVKQQMKVIFQWHPESIYLLIHLFHCTSYIQFK